MNSTKGCLQLTEQKIGQKLFPALQKLWLSNGDNGPGKLRPKRIPGGIVLVDTTFQFKEGL